MFKVNNKDTVTSSIGNFEHVIAGWVAYQSLKDCLQSSFSFLANLREIILLKFPQPRKQQKHWISVFMGTEEVN